MDYSYILNTSVPQKEKLLAFGFSEAGNDFALKKEIAGGQFYAEINLSDKTLTADVFETATNEKYVDFLHSYFNAPGDNPWAEEPYDSSTVYRCPNNKWFALIMQIKFKNLGFESDEPVWTVNLKAENVEAITDKKSIFPAYHMNKKYWITVLLTAVTDFEKLCELTKKSYALVQK